VAMLLIIGYLSISVFIHQEVFAKTPKEIDPCEVYKELVTIIEIAGINVVRTGHDEEMSQVIDFFDQYANKIMDLPAPEKGKC